MFAPFMALVNTALKNQNPQVKKQGEALFKTMYAEFGESVVKKLED